MRLSSTISLAAALLGQSASALPAGWEGTLTDELQSIATAEAKKWNCSFSISFRNGEGHADAAGGVVDEERGTAAVIGDAYVWGSITKVVTGSSVLKLISEGELELDGPAAPYVDRFLARAAARPDWNETWKSLGDLWGASNVSTTTIRELLHMQSRVPDFDTADPCGRDPKCVPTDPLRKTLYATKKAYSPVELMGVPWVAGRWNGPCEGRYDGVAPFCYSSTNFMLLGMILADFLNVSTWNDLDQSAFLPAALAADLRFANGGEPPSAYTPVAGYDRTSYNVPKGTHNDADDASVPGVFAGWTASDVVGTPSTIARLAWQVYGLAAVAPREYVDMMVPSSGGPDPTSVYEIYGLATHNLGHDVGQPNSDWGVAYGHLGATYGYQSIVAYFPKLNASIAVATNIETDYQQQPADALCLSYNKAVDVLLDIEHECTFTAGHDYQSGGCKCDPIKV